MKASEMTNEELANYLESITPDFEGYTSPVCEYFHEAAARLFKSKSINKELVDKNDALLAKLKVAEDALSQIASYSCICPSDHIAETALDAINDEGDAEYGR